MDPAKDIKIDEPKATLDVKEDKMTSKHEGIGFKLGNSFVGISTGKSANGWGIKLGPVLLGVATGPSKDDAKPATKT
jgi:hypothetical protein